MQQILKLCLSIDLITEYSDAILHNASDI